MAPPFVWAVVGISVVLRLAAAAYMGNAVEPLPAVFDQISYHGLAVRVLEGHGFSFGSDWWPATRANQPTAHWSFVYTLFLAGTYSIFGVHPVVARCIQAGLAGVLQPLLVWSISRRLFGARIGRVAAALVALYGYFVYYAGALVTESFYIVALLWAIDATLRLGESSDDGAAPRRRVGEWVELGGALAVAILLRQVLLVVVPFMFGWLLWRRARAETAFAHRRTRLAGVLLGMGVATLVIVVAVLPWTLRNYRVFGAFVPLNTNAGFAFFWGNHPVHGTTFIPLLPPGPQGYLELIPRELSALNEGELDRALLRLGVGEVLEDPVRYARLSVSRFDEYLKFWPSADSALLSNVTRVLSFGLLLPLTCAGLACLLMERRSRRPSPVLDPGILLLLVVASVHSLVYLMTWTLIRYRLPVDAIVMPFAALALVRVGDALVCVRSSRAVVQRAG